MFVLRLRLWRFCVIALLAALGPLAFSQGEKGPRRLEAEEFAILPWGWTPGDRDALRGIRECGFNLAGFVAPEHLDVVKEAGLKGIISDPAIHVGDAEAALGEEEVRKRVETVVRKAGSHPAVYGYYLRDEPSAAVFAGLARWKGALEAAAPGALAYINLFPNYASPAQLGTGTYPEHLEQYIEKVKPRFISYDHYALMDDGSLRKGYFQNLEAVRSVAMKNGIPFWNIVLSNAHFRYTEPTEAGLRFQLYTTLAYGGRGISYFTYFTPSIGNYRLGPVDPHGNKTPTWEMLRRVNLQLHALGPTYLKLKSIGVFHHPEVPEASAGLPGSRFVSELTGGNLLAGEFEGPENKPYVMVVNKDLHRSTAFGIKFKTPGTVHMVNAYTGAAHPWSGENNWLAAGQGMLLYLN